MSDGKWSLYSYDKAKLSIRAESGAALNAGVGNDILRIDKHSAFTT